MGRGNSGRASAAVAVVAACGAVAVVLAIIGGTLGFRDWPRAPAGQGEATVTDANEAGRGAAAESLRAAEALRPAAPRELARVFAGAPGVPRPGGAPVSDDSPSGPRIGGAIRPVGSFDPGEATVPIPTAPPVLQPVTVPPDRQPVTLPPEAETGQAPGTGQPAPAQASRCGKKKHRAKRRCRAKKHHAKRPRRPKKARTQRPSRRHVRPARPARRAVVQRPARAPRLRGNAGGRRVTRRAAPPRKAHPRRARVRVRKAAREHAAPGPAKHAAKGGKPR